MRLTMVGTGYVGLVTGTCLANTGNDVVCLDLDEGKIAKLKRGESPIYEPGLDDLLSRNIAAGRLRFTTDPEEAYARAEVIFVCVGTPSDELGRADLKYVLAASKDIGDALERRDDHAGEAPIVVVKSTVPVGTNARVQEAIAAATSKTFHMASNPEFLKEGAAIGDFNKPDRIVVGTHDERTAERMRHLYAPYVRQGNPILCMDVPSAEMVKYASNAMLATKISFINEIANLTEAYGAEIANVRRGMCADSRIGNKFLYPGLGYGGSCFPKDVLACMSMGRETGVDTELLDAVHSVNQRQRSVFLDKILTHFDGDPSGRTVAVWGIAFKPGTDDVREAPSITIMQALADLGAQIVAYDPVAHETGAEIMGDRIGYAESSYDALDGADALVICTEWSEFRTPDFVEMSRRMQLPVVFDGRNIYEPAEMRRRGFVYYSVGRRPVRG
ncbi:MAG: UDP-glucose/GDP-mannose dehydrogenase family protein [Myxococcota bacterium]